MERRRSPVHRALVLCFFCAIGEFADTIPPLFAEDQVIDLIVTRQFASLLNSKSESV